MGTTTTEREPLLSIEGAVLKYGDPGLAKPIVEAVIHLYESMITSGKLRSVSRSIRDRYGSLTCDDPTCMFMGTAYGFKFCPECGGAIEDEQ